MFADPIHSRLALPDPRSDGFVAELRQALIGRGLLDERAAKRAERVSMSANERFDVTVAQLGLVRDNDLVKVLSGLIAIPVLAPDSWPETPILQSAISTTFLTSNRIVPVADDGDAIRVAVADPFNRQALESLAYWLERPLRLTLAAASDVERCLERLHGRTSAEDRVADLATAVTGDEITSNDLRRLEDLASEAPVVRLVQDLIARAVEERASDIHIEPRPDSVCVRYRIDGALRTVETLPVTVQAALSSRIKIMARLNIAERRLPQDGRMRVSVRGREVDLRVSTMPTVNGESVVLRILDRESIPLDFERLGFAGPELAGFRQLLSEPNGIILVTGPTGSGKTTTLYTALQTLNRTESKLFTVEDPIEFQLPGINQIQVNPKIGLTFASALRSILRQDPDIVMVGEIRDLETAEIAVRASLTGHLVLSTIHTNSAAATLTRLLDMGVEDYLLATSLKGVLAQRLVRRLCPACATPAKMSKTDHDRIRALAAPQQANRARTVESADRVHEPRGCPECRHTGFRGRTTIYELMPLSGAVRDAISGRATERSIEAAAMSAGMATMLMNGAEKVLAGETTLEEVLRVTRSDDATVPL